MDKLREFASEREKRFYNLMSYEVFDLLDPKREMKIMQDDLKYLNELKNMDTSPLYEQKRRRSKVRRRIKGRMTIFTRSVDPLRGALNTLSLMKGQGVNIILSHFPTAEQLAYNFAQIKIHMNQYTTVFRKGNFSEASSKISEKVDSELYVDVHSQRSDINDITSYNKNSSLNVVVDDLTLEEEQSYEMLERALVPKALQSQKYSTLSPSEKTFYDRQDRDRYKLQRPSRGRNSGKRAMIRDSGPRKIRDFEKTEKKNRNFRVRRSSSSYRQSKGIFNSGYSFMSRSQDFRPEDSNANVHYAPFPYTQDQLNQQGVSIVPKKNKNVLRPAKFDKLGLNDRMNDEFEKYQMKGPSNPNSGRLIYSFEKHRADKQFILENKKRQKDPNYMNPSKLKSITRRYKEQIRNNQQKKKQTHSRPTSKYLKHPKIIKKKQEDKKSEKDPINVIDFDYADEDESVKTAKKFPPSEEKYEQFQLDSSRSEIIEDYKEVVRKNSKDLQHKIDKIKIPPPQPLSSDEEPEPKIINVKKPQTLKEVLENKDTPRNRKPLPKLKVQNQLPRKLSKDSIESIDKVMVSFQYPISKPENFTHNLNDYPNREMKPKLKTYTDIDMESYAYVPKTTTLNPEIVGYKPNFERQHMRFRTDRSLHTPGLHQLEYFSNTVHLSKLDRYKRPIEFYPKFWPYAPRTYPQ